MARRRSPARLVVALSVAGVLAVFLVYTSMTGGTPQLRPSQLGTHHGAVSLVGRVVGHPTGDEHATGGLRFQLRDVKGTARVLVVYHGSVPDLFRSGRDITVAGRYSDGVFTATPGSLVTKCPSKYTPARSSSQT